MARGRPKGDGQVKSDNLPEINKMIAKFLEDVAKDFSEYSDSIKSNEPVAYKLNIDINPHQQTAIIRTPAATKDGREPLVDVIDKGVELIVIAEVPGIHRENLTINANNNEVVIGDKTGKFFRRIGLNSMIEPRSGSATLRNGVLEVTFTKSNFSGKNSNLKVN